MMDAPPTLAVISLGEDPEEVDDRFLSINAFSRYTLRYGIR